MSLSEDLTNFKIAITDAVKECKQYIIDESKSLNHQITKVKILFNNLLCRVSKKS